MRWPREFGTIALVSIVTILIWLLAAAKTQQVETLAGRLLFTVASDSEGDRFRVTPEQIPITVTVEGPALAVRETRAMLTAAPLAIPLPADHGVQQLDRLTEVLQRLEAIADTGVTIVAVDPPSTSVDIAEFLMRTAVVRADIEQISTVQEVTVAPQEVTALIPRSIIHQLPEALIVDAVVDERDIARLEPGVLHTVDGALQLQNAGPFASDVTFDPATARVSFQLVARQRRAAVTQVRIQIASTPQDFGKWTVTLPKPLLDDVNIEASPELIQSVEAGQSQVVAMVHLTTNEKERGVSSKPVSFFAVLHADGTATPVTGSVQGDANPEVPLQIESATKKPASP